MQSSEDATTTQMRISVALVATEFSQIRYAAASAHAHVPTIGSDAEPRAIINPNETCPYVCETFSKNTGPRTPSFLGIRP